MKASWRKWFRPKQKYAIQLSKRIILDPEDAVALSSLRHHPGYAALMNRIALQRSYLETKLLNNRQKDIREVDILQNGIQWLSYVEELCEKATQNYKEKIPELAPFDVSQEFNKINSSIERVGSPQG